tara:strand:+ start:2333 stop:4195 length:1863 start_codon:yes stop_codon:yes gene_type:complete
MATPNRDIKYLNRDFSDFRARLIEFSQTYFPNTYNDFSPTSPGMLFMEQSAYVGDVLSFYLDNQLQENFIQYARQRNNIFELAYMFGYKPKTTGAAQVNIDFYQQLPAKTVGDVQVPDYNYTVTIPGDTTIGSSVYGNNTFIIQDKVDFSLSSSQDPTEISVYQISNDNQPQYFLLKKTRNAISSTVNTQTFDFTNPEQFATIDISSPNIIKVLDIIDDNENRYREVDHLGQEMIYEKISNTNVNDPNNIQDAGDVPYLLNLKKVQRRFASRFIDLQTLQIQFGAGTSTDSDENIVPNSNNIGIGLPFSQDKLTTAYSPTNFLHTSTYGIAPSNTTLTVRYLTGGGVNSNVPANSLTTLDTSNITFNKFGLDGTTANYIFTSITANNLFAAEGGRDGDTLEEIRQNTLSLISSQQRSVTAEDYLVRALSMPPEFGAISKAYVEKPKLTDSQVSTIETLNLFCLGLNSSNNFSTPSNTLKKNLRTYLSQYRIIGDNIEIRDAFIINIEVNFEIIVLPEFNNSEVLIACIEQLKVYFNKDKWQINQPIMLRDLYILLDKIKGVQSVKNIFIINKAGTSSGYSQYSYDIGGATQNQVIYPSLDPSIFEVKYLNQDIKGKVVPL